MDIFIFLLVVKQSAEWREYVCVDLVWANVCLVE